MFLPTIKADGQTYRFEVSSFGITESIHVEVLWNPVWPIVHPLVEQRRAQQIWPASGAPLDLSVLPGVHPREFSFVERSHLYLTDGAVALGLPPLSEDLDLDLLMHRGLLRGTSHGSG